METKKANKNSFLKFGSRRLACNSFERSYVFLWFLIYRLPENLPPLKLFMLKSAKQSFDGAENAQVLLPEQADCLTLKNPS